MVVLAASWQQNLLHFLSWQRTMYACWTSSSSRRHVESCVIHMLLPKHGRYLFLADPSQ